ncbi:MAG TPA: hypothetical protein VKQ31_01130 [Steroidobacteraceae bacterium]|nr:hypothetical protein [Steroidobacteraceae bacterium]
MRWLSIAVTVVAPLLLAACGGDSDKPDANAAPASAPAEPPQPQAAPPPAPADNAASVPLRQAPLGLVGPGSAAPSAPVASDAPSGPAAAGAAPAPPPQEPEDATPTEAEVRALYEGIMYTYAFDACGLPLIGERARQDIEQRIEICPNPPLRKDAFRTVYHRAIEVAQQDPEKLRQNASNACPDKHEFLRRVMSHASELTFDDSQPPDCGLLSPPPPATAPANPAAIAPPP